MIKYKLECKNCSLLFDSWFASSKEYEKLKRKNYLNCHSCGSINVEKTLMAPKLLNKSWKKSIYIREPNNQKVYEKIKKYQKFIKKNFEYVGENFAYEARSIHYKNKNKIKGIYGTASKEEIKDLKEEGIDTVTIPWVEDKNN
tara:strand:+ start:766 stop:1194 length:429 start_codon:yes stop_codon:yes gene_type:complete